MLRNTYPRIMSRGLGRLQLKVLEALARYEASDNQWLPGMLVEEIAYECGYSKGYLEPILPDMFRQRMEDWVTAVSSIRRALARMEVAGLVETQYCLKERGQPRIWKITDNGLAELRWRQPLRGRCAVLCLRASVFALALALPVTTGETRYEPAPPRAIGRTSRWTTSTH